MSDLITRGVGLLGWFGFLSLAGGPLAWTRYLFLFFLIPLIADLAGWWSRRRHGEKQTSDPTEGATPAPLNLALPLPGPAEGSGPLVLSLRYHVSSTLGLLNPRQFLQMLKQIRGQSLALLRAEGALPEADGYEQKVAYTLPFRGEWMVMNGGVTSEASHSWDLISQRYAYDFVAADQAGQRHRGDGSCREDYFAYGQPVLAAADGEVVRTVERVRDAPRVGTGWVDWRSRDIGGNSVTIRHAEGEFSYSAHLIPGSVCVRPGDRVRRGQEVGRCGHSGHSTEPHLHFQVQDHPDFFRAIGLPVRFSGAVVDGAPAASAVYLRAGMRVEGTDLAE